MTRLLIRSDGLVIRSDELSGSFLSGLAQSSPTARARFASDRAAPARHAGRDIQALWSAELPLRQWNRTWPEAVSVNQPARRAAAKGLRAQQCPFAGRPIDRQLPKAAPSARRDLCDQCGTPATTRGSWINRHGPGTRRFRLRQGGRHPRRNGRVLSCRRRPAVRSGGAR
jgi:hypothetical protein